MLHHPTLRRVKAQFGTRIAVKTVAGVVYLDGVVENDAQRSLAETLAWQTRQVEYVVNRLKVL